MKMALTRSELDRRLRAAGVTITGAMRTTPTKMLEILLDLPQLGTVVEAVALAAACRLRRPNQNALKIGHSRIWIKAER